jgi:hypothetical protein
LLGVTEKVPSIQNVLALQSLQNRVKRCVLAVHSSFKNNLRKKYLVYINESKSVIQQSARESGHGTRSWRRVAEFDLDHRPVSKTTAPVGVSAFFREKDRSTCVPNRARFARGVGGGGSDPPLQYVRPPFDKAKKYVGGSIRRGGGSILNPFVSVTIND